MNTQFGKIAELTQSVEQELSPLQKEMEKVVQLVAILAMGLGIPFFFLGYFVAGLALIEGFVFAVGIIVANVPEGLLPTVSLSLAMGVQRMAGRNALIKKLSSVETLGCTTVICTDKTGTLTKNEMTVREIWVDGPAHRGLGSGYDPAGEFHSDGQPLDADQRKALQLLVRAAASCNNARLIDPPRPGRHLDDPRRPDRGGAARRRQEGRLRPRGRARDAPGASSSCRSTRCASA